MDFSENIANWAAIESSVQGVILIGSRVRAEEDAVWRADLQSDWDFQIITSKPKMFLDSAWAVELGLKVCTYTTRQATLGAVPKVAVVFDGSEADFVILPSLQLRVLRLSIALGLQRRSAWLRSLLQALAIVIRPGWKFIKGASAWEPFYRRVIAEVPDPRVNDYEACALADGFVCDTIWTWRKIDRGELIAAQRMLYRSLAETNFRLLHELKLRRGERSFPEARRIERVASQAELTGVSIESRLDPRALREAVEKSGVTLQQLMKALVNDAWHWPRP
jgi:hypothetical protein